MHRRAYVGLVVGGATALAGCLGDDEGGADLDPADLDREGERAIYRAVGALNRATVALLAAAETFEEGETDPFDPDDALAHVEDGRGNLETAETAADDREADVELLRTYATFLEATAQVTASVTDDAFAADVEAVGDAIADDRLDDARAILDDVRERIEIDQDRLDDAAAALEEIDAQRLYDVGAVERADLEAGLEEIRVGVDALDALTQSYGKLLTGSDHLDAGEVHLDEGEYADAETSFENGRMAFGNAERLLDDEREDAPGSLDDQFDVGICRASTLLEAAEHFEAAAEALADGDPVSADSRRSDADAALDRADDCA